MRKSASCRTGVVLCVKVNLCQNLRFFVTPLFLVACAFVPAACGDEYGVDDVSLSGYVLDVSSPPAVSCDNTPACSFVVRSYRSSADKKQQYPVAWAVTGYDADGDGVFSMTEKPFWLVSLSCTSGQGGIDGEKGLITLAPMQLTDRLTPLNAMLRQASVRGTATHPYDLSSHDCNGRPVLKTTANSYLISAPGFYRLPLVYGNAVTNGRTNEHAYKTENVGNTILSHFVDHAGHTITSPYINVQNSTYPAVSATVVWADEPLLVLNPTVRGRGADSYMDFEVSRENIRNGNAVVAVQDENGTTLWSWHLWFAPAEALDVVTCTNHDQVSYRFSKETLGWKYTAWMAPEEDNPRTVGIRIEQMTDDAKQLSEIMFITQKSGGKCEGYSTFYQFGRKDAFPGIDKGLAVKGSFKKNAGGAVSISQSIRHPGSFYIWDGGQSKDFAWNNLWSMDNMTVGFNDASVVKTIYDPCPPGFHLPASNAFTGFNFTGLYTGREEMNAIGSWKRGWHFKGRKETRTTTVFFPASGCRGYSDGVIRDIGRKGYDKDTKNVWNEKWVGHYWTAMPSSEAMGCAMYHTPEAIAPLRTHYKTCGYSVHPVAE